jgi:DNA-binding FadR family transcriptional regulator
MTFSPLPPRESAAEACTNALRTAILQAKYPPGSRLPPERELAELFGVNRVTVRSALTQLEAQSLVSVRQGSGYSVRDFERTGGPELISSLVSLARSPRVAANMVRDLLFVRRHLARAVLERVVARGPIPQRALHRLRERIRALEVAAKSRDTRAIAEADLAVLAEIVAEAQSPVLALCMNPIAAVLRDLPLLRDAMYTEPARNIESYEVVVNWLGAGRPDLIDTILAELARHDEATVNALGRARRGKRKRGAS